MSNRLMKLLPLLVVAIGILVSAGLYLSLIYTNCGTSGPLDLLSDVRDFHTQNGC